MVVGQRHDAGFTDCVERVTPCAQHAERALVLYRTPTRVCRATRVDVPHVGDLGRVCKMDRSVECGRLIEHFPVQGRTHVVGGAHRRRRGGRGGVGVVVGG